MYLRYSYQGDFMNDLDVLKKLLDKSGIEYEFDKYTKILIVYNFINKTYTNFSFDKDKNLVAIGEE